MRQVGLELTELAANVAKITILAVSLVNIAILAASLAALLRQYQLGAFRQHYSSSAKVIKELQVFHTQNQSHPHDRWLCVSCVARAQQAKALNKLWSGISH